MISDKAIIQTHSSNIGTNVEISEFAIIRPDVIIGADSVIHPNVVINSGVRIGKNVK